MRSSLETTRTIMRPFELTDAAEAFSWFGHPEVMRYAPTGADSTVDKTASRIGRYIDHQKRNGFSKWVIIDRDSQRLIGDSGLYLLPEGRGVELGYRLSHSYWGQGLATEVSRKWIDVASEFFDSPTLFAFAHPENSVSLRIIRKLGFKFLRDEVFYGLPASFFELSLATTNNRQADETTGILPMPDS